MKTYPILYKLSDLVSGNGYVADIRLAGRAIVVEEAPQEWWAYGVNPGAIAGQGTTIIEAFADLQRNFRRYLADCLKDASSIAALREELDRFYRECDDETLQEWEAAVRKMKAGAELPEGMGKEHTETAEQGFQVTEVGTPTPIAGGVDDHLKVAA